MQSWSFNSDLPGAVVRSFFIHTWQADIRSEDGSSAEANYHYSLAVHSLLSGNIGNAIKEYETARTL